MNEAVSVAAMSANHLWIANYASAASKLSSNFEIGEVYIIYFLGWTTKGVHCTEGVEVIAKVN